MAAKEASPVDRQIVPHSVSTVPVSAVMEQNEKDSDEIVQHMMDKDGRTLNTGGIRMAK